MYSKRYDKFRAEAYLRNKDLSQSIDISDYLVSVVEKNDYINNIFQGYLINLKVPGEVKDFIDSGSLEVNIKLYRYDGLQIEEDDEEIPMDEIIMDSELRLSKCVVSPLQQQCCSKIA